jgi:hypothetical protein
MTTLDPNDLRQIASFEDVIEFLTDELDWPINTDDLEEATFEWSSDELGLPPERVPHLASLRQLRPLATDQPWGIFFLEFDGPRLPLTALRRLLDKLVTKQRSSGSGTLKTWKLDDLLFIITTSTGETVELHLVAFFEQRDKLAEIRSIPWRPGQSPAQHLKRLATELLPHLTWPDDPAAVDEWREGWRAAFKLRHGEVIATTSRLVERMSTTAIQLRDSIAAALVAEAGSGPFSMLLEEVRQELVASATPRQFADMCAQTLVYGALTSRVTDPGAFGASPTLSSIPLANPFLTAFFEEVHDHAVQLDGDDHLEQLVADLKASNVEAVLDKFGATEKGGDPVIHFYEDFLAAYDPEMKIRVGAFYTPQAAVKHMVGMVDAVLRERLGLPLGVADATSWGELAGQLDLTLPGIVDPATPFVSMLDPATGTGTFLVEWIRRARGSYLQAYGPSGWPDHARDIVLPSLHALELMLAPYAIAHLKTALELHDADVDDADLAIYLTDTLQRGTAQLSIHPDPISVEGERADNVKRTVRTTVAIGNPPYDRVAQGDGSGGWITDRSGGRSPFDDVLDPAREHTIFSHHASLYNKYVYFWRWVIWKVFEDRPGLPGVVSFITPSSWLTGPGFIGLRQLVREVADEIWVADLGGDNRGMRRDPNIFDIETPVAIVTMVRSGGGDHGTPAVGWHRRVVGSRAEKLDHLGAPVASLSDSEWSALPSGWHQPLEPASGGLDWLGHPALTDLIPWQQPGCKFGRTWPIAPSVDLARSRWDQFMSMENPDERVDAFVTPSTGRTIHTNVGGFTRLVDEPAGASPRDIIRYGYRSFDRQWAFDDPRLTALERPALWASVSPQQIFLVSKPTHPIGEGPAATASTSVPDLHFFRGSFGGKDVFPLYRDANGTPNADPALLRSIAAHHGRGGEISAEDLFAYAYAVLAGADYTHRFAEELTTPGPRVPLSGDASLFTEAVELGQELLWLQTFGERFGAGRGSILVSSILVGEGLTLPEKPSDITYSAVSQSLRVGNGEVLGVTPEVWAFEVSGMPVVKKWLAYRTAKGAGRAASSSSSLDRIRPAAWLDDWTTELLELLSVLHRTLELQPRGIDLLDRLLAGPLVNAADLPQPPASLRMSPTGGRGPTQAGLGI